MKKIIIMIITIVMVGLYVPSKTEVANAAGNPTIKISGDSITINGKKYTESEFDKLLKDSKDVTFNAEPPVPIKEGTAQPAFAPAIIAGSYFIPGLGEITLAATGAIIIGGVAIKAGSLIGKKIKHYFSNPRKVMSEKYDIPQRLLDSNGKVKVKSFNHKVKGKTAYKEPKGWTIEKDRDGHKGSKWKVKNSKGKRKASIKGNGQIVGK